MNDEWHEVKDDRRGLVIFHFGLTGHGGEVGEIRKNADWSLINAGCETRLLRVDAVRRSGDDLIACKLARVNRQLIPDAAGLSIEFTGSR